ncbi:dienelactone hydrolase family protein [Bradyrhizobium sp. HKCCYLS2038]|uniref:dienelactone hydrolase family protein n=1 Tax=unclassified Bradyrhizobium TaxID=2631580 RepID=UPI003EC09207
MTSRLSTGTSEVTIPPSDLVGTLTVPQHARGLIIFAHGSGSSRQSPRNQAVAGALNKLTFATLLFDLLTPSEEADRANVFDISLLAERLVNVVQWLGVQEPSIAALPVGLFGASTGAAAALVTAARLPERVRAVVSRGGRPDLAGHALPMVRSPTLLIVGGADFSVIELNQAALTELAVPKALEIIPGATHLFSEPGAMDAVIAHAAHWFDQYLTARGRQGPRTE